MPDCEPTARHPLERDWHLPSPPPQDTGAGLAVHRWTGYVPACRLIRYGEVEVFVSSHHQGARNDPFLPVCGPLGVRAMNVLDLHGPHHLRMPDRPLRACRDPPRTGRQRQQPIDDSNED